MAKTTNPLTLSEFLIPASQLKDEVGRVFPTVLSMDIGLSGGITEGSTVLIAGASKSGKTSFTLDYISQCHQKDPEKKAFFFDAEGRLRPELLKCIKGLDLERLHIIRSNEKKILSAENFLALINQTLKDYPKSIVVLDSIAALAPEAELSTIIGDSVKMASTASLMYKLFRAISQTLVVTKSTFIGLTHLVANPGPGKASFAVGGNAMKYGSSVNLEARWVEKIKYGENNIVGQLIHFTVVASALGPPGAEVKVPIIYGKGIDHVMDLVNVALELGTIILTGAWYSLPLVEKIGGVITLNYDIPIKIQGKEKVVEYLNDNLEMADLLELYIRNMVFQK